MFTAVTGKIAMLDIFSAPRDYTEKILEIVCNELSFKFASLIDLQGKNDGEIFCSYNFPEEYSIEVNRTACILSSPSGETIKTGSIVIVHNPLEEPRLSPWYHLIAPYNLKTIIWIPILNMGKTFAILTLYDTEERIISQQEEHCLKQIELITSITLANNRYLDSLNEKTRELYSEIERHKKTERKLANSQQNFKTILDNSPNIFVRFDRQMHYTYINPAGEKALGYKYDYIVGKKINQLPFLNDPSKYLEKKLNEVFETQVPQNISIQFIEKNNLKMQYNIDLIPEAIDDLADKTILCVAQDMTEYNRIKEEQIKHSKIESMGILAGEIAHEFNNILTVILGNVSLGKIGLDIQDKLYKRLDEIETASIQAQKLTQQFLTFSKGGFPLKQLCYIPDLVKEAINLALTGSKIGCEFSVENGIPMAEIDCGQINEVINNIVINSIEAMPKGGTIKANIHNTLSYEKNALTFLSRHQDYITISIQDQGIGISEECLDKIFDPYFTTKQNGTGLGLTVAYSILKKHNAHIQVDSKLGAGTTFNIYLPVCHKESVINVNTKRNLLLSKSLASCLVTIGWFYLYYR